MDLIFLGRLDNLGRQIMLKYKALDAPKIYNVLKMIDDDITYTFNYMAK